MTTPSTDEHWEQFGKEDPYWAVLTHDEFRKGTLDDQAIQRFFQSGEEHVARILEVIRLQLVPGFSPASALDFGCGVGRLALPLATRCSRVVGVDVSPSMLEEARRNTQARRASGVEWVLGDDTLSRVTGRFDLVHTYIVLQHIPPERGLPLFRRLVDLVAPGGVGALQLTYNRVGFTPPAEGPLCHWPPPVPPPPDTLWVHLRGVARAFYRRLVWLFQGARSAPPPTGPEMQMNQYALNPVFQTLQAAGVTRFVCEFTDHGGDQGLMLLFQKPK